MSLLLLFPSSGAVSTAFCWVRLCTGPGPQVSYVAYDYDYLDTWTDWGLYTWAQVSATHGTG